MADITFTDEELEEVDRICADLDPETHELTRPFLDSLESLGFEEEREWAIGYFRRAIRSELIMGLMLRAVTDGALLHDAASPIGSRSALNWDFDNRYHYKSAPLEAFRAGESTDLEVNYTIREQFWQHDFGCSGELHRLYGIIWKAEERKRGEAIRGKDLLGGDNSLPDVERFNALLGIAHNRMFGDLDDDLELLQSGD